MHVLQSRFRFFAVPLILFVGSCMNDPGGDPKPPKGNQSFTGTFLVSLVEPVGELPGYTSVQGIVNSGPNPSTVIWKETGKNGACRVLKPSVPFCELPCGSGAACVEDNKCQDYPKMIEVGKVDVKGLKTNSGATEFTMVPVGHIYQLTGGITLAFPPFAEGGSVVFSATGDTSVSAFTVSATGISPLQILNDSLILADGKPLNLQWTPPKSPGNTRVSVVVDISHHGGTKGKIECEAPDAGTLEIAAPLVDQLKGLGISGFPKIEIARKAVGTNATVHVDLILESAITRPLAIPGLISCNPGDECPAGQTCQQDLRCK